MADNFQGNGALTILYPTLAVAVATGIAGNYRYRRDVSLAGGFFLRGTKDHSPPI